MTTMNVVDLSFISGEQQDLADLPYGAEMLNSPGGTEGVQELNISHAHVLALTSAPEAPINDILRFVTVLRASHNEVDNLRGVEAFVSLEVLDLSFNCLRVVDAHATALLKTLKRLRTIDFSHNYMRLLDLDGSLGAPSPRLTGQKGPAGPLASSSLSAGTGGGRLVTSSSVAADTANSNLASLTAIDLSHNAFIEVPDLRSAPFLQVLNISHNQLEAVADLDVRLPLLSLHSLLLHANRLPHVSALVPLSALAATLKHTQLFHNPFTFAHGSVEEGADETLWWRPFMLFLCPLLVTVDQTEFTTSERRVAMHRLFREHGSLSRSTVELMNPQNKDVLETYLRRQSEAAEPPADALVVIKELEDEEAQERETARPSRRYEGAAAVGGDDDDGNDGAYTADVVVPMSRMNTVREQSLAEDNGPRSKGSSLPYYAEPANGAAVTTASTRTVTRVVIVDPNSQQKLTSSLTSPVDRVLLTNHNRQRAKAVPITTVVRALQQKTRSLEEVVTVLWRGDLARRTAAALVIQRYMRGALARKRLSDDDAESCRFIRYQLQQAAMATTAQKATQPTTAGGAVAVGTSADADVNVTGASHGHSTRSTAVYATRQPSIDAIEAGGSNIAEVLVSMRSLQEVMSSMWVDLEEYRAMADREQRRAAVLIQRWYRGYCVRRDFGRVRHCSSSMPSRATVSPACKCAGRTAALQKEVSELRHEVRELRQLLAQTSRQQRLADYDDPERAMDDIVRKHEARVSADRNHAANTHEVGDSRSPSATPSITAADIGMSQERNLQTSTPRGESHHDVASREQVMESASKSPSQSKMQLHRMPQQPSSRISPAAPKSPTSGNPATQARGPTRITKRRPSEFPLSSSLTHPVSPNGDSAESIE